VKKFNYDKQEVDYGLSNELWMECVVRTLALSPPTGGPINDVFHFKNKSQLQFNEVCYKVSLCENFQQ